jgi:hypothetical protein
VGELADGRDLYQEGHPIFDAWNTGLALHAERLASVFGLCPTEGYQAEIVPLGTTGRVMTFLWLPDQQLANRVFTPYPHCHTGVFLLGLPARKPPLGSRGVNEKALGCKLHAVPDPRPSLSVLLSQVLPASLSPPRCGKQYVLSISYIGTEGAIMKGRHDDRRVIGAPHTSGDEETSALPSREGGSVA